MRRHARLTCLAVVPALAGSILFGSNVTAQVVPRAAVMGGVRVRVTYPGMRRRVGTLVSMNRDTLVARWESGMTSRMAIPRVSALDISMGRFPQPIHGAKVGAAIGLASGVILSVVAGGGASVAVGGAALGASVGWAVGIVRPRDTWRPWWGEGPRAGWAIHVAPASPLLEAGTHVGMSRAF